MQPSTVRVPMPQLPQPAAVPAPYSTTISKAQPTVFVDLLHATQVFVESEEASNVLTTVKECILRNPMSVAVGGSLALLAGAAWMKSRSKSETILALQMQLSEQVRRGNTFEKRITFNENTITSLLLMVQRASELEQKLRDGHRTKEDGLQRQVGALKVMQMKMHKKSNDTITTLFLIIQRTSEANDKLRRDYKIKVDGITQQLTSLQSENTHLLATQDGVLIVKVADLEKNVASLKEQLTLRDDKETQLKEQLKVSKDKEISTEASKRLSQEQLKETTGHLRSANENAKKLEEKAAKDEGRISQLEEQLGLEKDRVSALVCHNEKLKDKLRDAADARQATEAKIGNLERINGSLASDNEKLKNDLSRAVEAEQVMGTKVEDLEKTNSSLVSRNEKLENDLNRAIKAGEAMDTKVTGLETRMESMDANTAEMKASANAYNEKVLDEFRQLKETNQRLMSDVKALKSQVASLEKDKTESKAALKRAVDAEKKATSEQRELKAQNDRLRELNQKVTGELVNLRKTIVAAAKKTDTPAAPKDSSTEASAAPKDSTKASTPASGNPKDSPKPDNDNAEGSTAEPSVEEAGAAANKDEESASVRKQAASKRSDSTRAHHLELRITQKAADFKGLVDFEPLNYAELAEKCRGFGADDLDLVAVKMMEMADQGVELKIGIAEKMGDPIRDFVPKVDQGVVEWAIRGIKEEAEAGRTQKPQKLMPISKERRHGLLQRYKASSVKRASDIDWELMTKMSDGLNGPLIEMVVNEAFTTMIVSKRTEITQADLASAIDKVQDEERRSAAKVPSRGGFGFNPRGNNSNDNNSPSSSQRGGRERGGRGGRGGASGPPLPKIPDFILKAREEKKKQQQK